MPLTEAGKGKSREFESLDHISKQEFKLFLGSINSLALPPNICIHGEEGGAGDTGLELNEFKTNSKIPLHVLFSLYFKGFRCHC